MTTVPATRGQAPADELGLGDSPPGKLMVANANIKAALGDRFINSSGPRMRLLVARLLADISARGGLWRPDIVLLQEAITDAREPRTGIVDDLSAARVASELSLETGDPYGVVVNPGYKRARGVGVATETAIVANLATMQEPVASGFVATPTFKRKLRLNGPGPSYPARAPTRRHAWALIAERDPEGLAFPVASVHLLTDRRLGCAQNASCQSRINVIKSRWARQVNDHLFYESGSSIERAVIGGDFNATRKERFYDSMLEFGFEKAAGARVDFIFSQGPFGTAGIDQAPRDQGPPYPLGYSDHRFMWSQVG